MTTARAAQHIMQDNPSRRHDSKLASQQVDAGAESSILQRLRLLGAAPLRPFAASPEEDSVVLAALESPGVTPAHAPHIQVPAFDSPFVVLNEGPGYRMEYEGPGGVRGVVTMPTGGVHVIPPFSAGSMRLTQPEGKYLRRLLMVVEMGFLQRFALENSGGRLELQTVTPVLGGADPVLASVAAVFRQLLGDPEPIALVQRETARQLLAAHLLRDHAMLRDHTAQPGGGLPNRRLKRVLALMHEGFSNEVSLEAMAEEAGFSPFYFSRLFKEAVGVSPRQYLIALRMDEAKRLLDQGVDTREVAERVGYASLSHFASLFKRHTGATPGSYRKGRR